MKVGMRWPVVSFLLLAFLFLLGSTAHAYTTTDGYTYADGMDGVIITGYTGTDVNLVVPDTIEGLPVTAIGNSAFEDNDTLTSIDLPDSLNAIGDYAFYECSSLVSVDFSKATPHKG